MMKEFLQVTPPEIMDQAIALIGRKSRPDEQDQALLFLNCDAASYISGSTFVVDAAQYAGQLSRRTAVHPNMRESVTA
jgi:NAD(P)-dependent dehydrogenase (short-subunit alcohol dehydrogenase family)